MVTRADVYLHIYTILDAWKQTYQFIYVLSWNQNWHARVWSLYLNRRGQWMMYQLLLAQIYWKAQTVIPGKRGVLHNTAKIWVKILSRPRYDITCIRCRGISFIDFSILTMWYLLGYILYIPAISCYLPRLVIDWLIDCRPWAVFQVYSGQEQV